MTLPSAAAGVVTQEVGLIHAAPDVVVPWLRDGLGDGWRVRSVSWGSLEQVSEDLAPSPALTRHAVVPINGWTLLLTNGPLGTDVGMLPSLAARQLGCRAVRAVCVDDDEGEFPARIMELFGPDGSGPLLTRRAIVAANDGGEWVFETSGEPLPFEQLDRYERRRKSERFTRDLLYDYLRRLDAPIDVDADWRRAQLVELGES